METFQRESSAYHPCMYVSDNTQVPFLTVTKL